MARKLPTPERVRFFRIIIRGRGDFPADMLRYDCCYPETSADAAKIGEGGMANVRDIRLIRVVGVGEDPKPTFARWLSFGWDARFGGALTDSLTLEDAR